MAELVREDEEHDADAELPTPDERVPADGEEDPEELEDEGAELEHDAEEDDERREQPREQPGARSRWCSLGSVAGSGAVAGSRSLS